MKVTSSWELLFALRMNSPLRKMSSSQSAIAQGQDQLLAALTGHRISGIKRFQYLPYMAMTVDEAGLGELINYAAVVRIFKDEMISHSPWPKAFPSLTPMTSGRRGILERDGP